MSKYIDADALIKEATSGLYDIDGDDLETAINYTPAADVAPVVRCKDCIFADPGIHRRNSKMCRLTKLEYDDNCYCSFGERTDGYNCGTDMREVQR